MTSTINGLDLNEGTVTKPAIDTAERKRHRSRRARFFVDFATYFGLACLIRLLVPDSVGDPIGAAAWLVHPFWIPVILLAAQHGFSGALSAAITASLAYVMLDLPGAQQLLTADQYHRVAAQLPMSWLFGALLVGFLVNRQHVRLRRQQARLRELNDQVLLLADSLESSLQRGRRLERQVAGDTSSMLALMQRLPNLDLRPGRQLLETMAPFIARYVRTTDMAVYVREGDDLVLAAACGRRSSQSPNRLRGDEHGHGAFDTARTCSIPGVGDTPPIGLLAVHAADVQAGAREVDMRLQLAAQVLAELDATLRDPVASATAPCAISGRWMFPTSPGTAARSRARSSTTASATEDLHP